MELSVITWWCKRVNTAGKTCLLKAFCSLWRNKVILKAQLKIFQLLCTFSNQFHEKRSFDVIFPIHCEQKFIQFEIVTFNKLYCRVFDKHLIHFSLIFWLTMTKHKKKWRCTLHESLTMKNATIKLKKIAQITLEASFCSREGDNMSFQFSRRWGRNRKGIHGIACCEGIFNVLWKPQRFFNPCWVLSVVVFRALVPEHWFDPQNESMMSSGSVFSGPKHNF